MQNLLDMTGATARSRSRYSRDESTANTNEISYDETPAYYVSMRDQWTEHMSKAYERWTILGENFTISLIFPRKYIRVC